MIILTKEHKFSQSREVRPVYAPPDQVTAENWGKPIEMKASESVDLHIELDVSYVSKDPADRKLIDALMKAVREVVEASDHGRMILPKAGERG